MNYWKTMSFSKLVWPLKLKEYRVLPPPLFVVLLGRPLLLVATNTNSWGGASALKLAGSTWLQLSLIRLERC